jgi:hypothetical protein
MTDPDVTTAGTSAGLRIRILGEGQFLVPEMILAQLNDLDRQIDADLAGKHPEEFGRHLAEMHRLVREHGKRTPADDLAPSDAVLPPAGSTLDELRGFLGEQGLVPDQ